MEKYPESFAVAHLDEKAFSTSDQLHTYLTGKSREELGNKSHLLLLPVPNFTQHCEIVVTHPEFLCLCPKTGLPDIAAFTIIYVPDKNVMELKSFKLFTTLFRNMGIFHENVTQFLGDVIWNEIRPKSLKIEGVFNARGGIGTTVKYQRGNNI